MKQHRDLVPITIYLPPEVKAAAEERAAAKLLATAALLRLIVCGHEPPLPSPDVRAHS